MNNIKFISGMVLSFTLLLTPTIVTGAELHSEFDSNDTEMNTMAFETGISISAPSTIRGVTANAIITLNFSGDKNGSGQYRYNFNPGDGHRSRTGVTSSTKYSLSQTYNLGNRNSASHNLNATVSGYSSDSARRTIAHRR